MSVDRLRSSRHSHGSNEHLTGTTEEGQVDRSVTAQATEKAVLAVLAGTPLARAAAQIAMEAADLADAIKLYQAAGRAVLEAQTDSRGWYQVRVEFDDWDTAEHAVVTHLGPKLAQAETAGVVSSWWYIRKAPCWRLRFHAGTTSLERMKEFVDRALDGMASQNLITKWWASIYEPETAAFGGSGGMDLAHHLFHADSNAILDYLSRHDPTAPSDQLIRRRELSFLLCSALMRAAGQEWHEQGDVWHRVARMRPLPPGIPFDRLHGMTDNLHRLMALDTRPTTELVGTDGPLAFALSWFAAFTEAGHALGDAASDGTLERGIRDILAHHVIFHWNRLGLTAPSQGILARAAVETIMNAPGSMPNTRDGTTPDVAGA
jgi:thiopeptide-type bacteriocin biosynthesis protein